MKETGGLVEKWAAQEITHSETCTIFEYTIPSSSTSFITAKIDGRYPETGRSVNSGCEQIYYVISGEGTLHTDRGIFTLHPGDLYHFQKGEGYYVEGNALEVAVINSPPWEKEQYLHLEEDN
jgi:mannose-6-phosphate isomerase-like protein (cupin superfamily)